MIEYLLGRGASPAAPSAAPRAAAAQAAEGAALATDETLRDQVDELRARVAEMASRQAQQAQPSGEKAIPITRTYPTLLTIPAGAGPITTTRIQKFTVPKGEDWWTLPTVYWPVDNLMQAGIYIADETTAIWPDREAAVFETTGFAGSPVNSGVIIGKDMAVRCAPKLLLEGRTYYIHAANSAGVDRYCLLVLEVEVRKQ